MRADGSLDFPDEVLSQLDIVIAALHSGLRGIAPKSNRTDAQCHPQPQRGHHRPP